jgi:hypothetical protein
MTSRPSLLLAAALCALAPIASADEPRRAPRPPQQQQARQEKRLSDEDAEVVRQLALLEQVDLLRNLDLFEPPPPPAQAKQQPDAGPLQP